MTRPIAEAFHNYQRITPALLETLDSFRSLAIDDSVFIQSLENFLASQAKQINNLELQRGSWTRERNALELQGESWRKLYIMERRRRRFMIYGLLAIATTVIALQVR